LNLHFLYMSGQRPKFLDPEIGVEIGDGAFDNLIWPTLKHADWNM